MSILVSVLFILLYLFVAGALFRGMLQYDTFGLCLIAEIKRWRNRHG